jgi:hypothetical protein
MVRYIFLELNIDSILRKHSPRRFDTSKILSMVRYIFDSSKTLTKTAFAIIKRKALEIYLKPLKRGLSLFILQYRQLLSL